jgi:hypothetical protein
MESDGPEALDETGPACTDSKYSLLELISGSLGKGGCVGGLPQTRSLALGPCHVGTGGTTPKTNGALGRCDENGQNTSPARRVARGEIDPCQASHLPLETNLPLAPAGKRLAFRPTTAKRAAGNFRSASWRVRYVSLSFNCLISRKLLTS